MRVRNTVFAIHKRCHFLMADHMRWKPLWTKYTGNLGIHLPKGFFPRDLRGCLKHFGGPRKVQGEQNRASKSAVQLADQRSCRIVGCHPELTLVQFTSRRLIRLPAKSLVRTPCIAFQETRRNKSYDMSSALELTSQAQVAKKSAAHVGHIGHKHDDVHFYCVATRFTGIKRVLSPPRVQPSIQLLVSCCSSAFSSKRGEK